ncbi:MAG: hypothetical protein ACLTKQ_07130 [Acutalibacteraceae bacterium]
MPSAAKAIKNAKSWKKLGNISWGFTDWPAKAQQGFVNGSELRSLPSALDGVLVSAAGGRRLGCWPDLLPLRCEEPELPVHLLTLCS